MHFVGLYEIDFARTAKNIRRFFDLRITGLRAVVQSVIADDSFAAVEYAIEGVDMGVVMDARPCALPCLAFGQSVDRKTEVLVLVE